MERGQRAGRTYPFLSNFGVLDPERLTLGDLTPTRAVVLPVAGHPPFGMLGASSYQGELTLSMGYARGRARTTPSPWRSSRARPRTCEGVGTGVSG